MQEVQVAPEAMKEINKAAVEALKEEVTPKIPRFQVGELFPFKGVWFVVKEVTKTGLVLEAKAFTKKGVPR